MPEVILPRLADTLEEGTVSRWLKHPGERVARGEPLVEIETDKVNTELESPYEGVVTEIVAPEGATVPVGDVLARIDAAEQGDPKPVDSEATAPPAQASTSPPVEAGLSPRRRRIAERMQEARATIRQGSCSVEVELSSVERQGGWTAHFVKAAALGGGFSDVGVAVEVPGGLLVPVLRGADHRPISEISPAVQDLVERAREDRLVAADVTGGEFTVTNVGSVGTLMAFPLVNPGQAAILAPGAVVDGRCWLTLCYDRAAMTPPDAEALLERIAGALT